VRSAPLAPDLLKETFELFSDVTTMYMQHLATDIIECRQIRSTTEKTSFYVLRSDLLDRLASKIEDSIIRDELTLPLKEVTDLIIQGRKSLQ